MELRPYQNDCLRASELAAQNGITRQLWVLATGLGKTVLVSEFLRRRGPAGTLGVMHREELLAQSAEKIQHFCPGATIGVEKAESRAVNSGVDVILASVQTVGRKDSDRLPAPTWLRTLWIDEAHHAPADGYLRVADRMGLRAVKDGPPPRRDAMLIGTTATPDRLDKLGHDTLFDDVTYRYELPEAIRDGWLADVKAFRIASNADLAGVATRQGDFANDQLAKALLRSNMSRSAAETWKTHGRGTGSIFFCVTKEHAAMLLADLKDAGANAELVTEDTSRDERRVVVEEFKRGQLECLVNVAVFTEGFDAPETRAIHILRPTKSKALYLQMLGRGTRKTPTKSSVDLFDYTPGGCPGAYAATDIFGLPDAWEMAGQSLAEDKREVDELAEKMPLDLSSAVSLRDLKDRTRRIEIFKASLTDCGLTGKLAWMRAPGKDRWHISWKNETAEKLARVPERWRAQADLVISRYGLWGVAESATLAQNELGAWEVTLADGKPTSTRISSSPKQRLALADAETWIREQRPHKVALLNRSGAWRKEPASEPQKQMLSRAGIAADVIGLVTKAEASALIDMGQEARKLFGDGA